MKFPSWSRYVIIGAELMVLSSLLLTAAQKPAAPGSLLSAAAARAESGGEEQKQYIKWVDFTVPAEVMTAAYRLDVDTRMQDIHHDWIELLAWLAARYGGDFTRYKESDLTGLCETLQNGQTMESLTSDLKYYPYYLEAYQAVLGGLVGDYEIQVDASDASAFAPADAVTAEKQPQPWVQEDAALAELPAAAGTGDGFHPIAAVPDSAGAPAADASVSAPGAAGSITAGAAGGSANSVAAGSTDTPAADNSRPKTWVSKYGLKAFLPIARYFPYQEYDDFGVSRSYGYKRQHLGHDMIGQVGTPIIAVESGYVEAIGWNQYGGWRLGIRSLDKKRYYYYAHLRQNYPYHKSLAEGSIVQAGDVIGYMGRTGYSPVENTNNIDTPHLHFGIQLIFDESQKEGNNEIWIDCYQITRFLAMNRSETFRNPETKEYNRVYEIRDPAVTNRSD